MSGEPPSPTPGQLESADETAQELAETFAFTEDQAKALVYREMYGFSRQQSADAIGTSVTSFDNQYNKARNRAFDILDIAESLQGLRRESLTPEVGGQVGAYIERLSGEVYRCQGCDGVHRLHARESFYGWYHDDGLPDARGRTWWLIAPCPDGTDYDNSWTTLQSNLMTDATEFSVLLRECADQEDHYLSLEVYNETGDEQLAESRFVFTPDRDAEEPLTFDPREQSDGWEAVWQSIIEWEETEGFTLTQESPESPQFCRRDSFYAEPDSKSDSPMAAHIEFDQPNDEFIFIVEDGLRTWFREAVPVQDLNLTRETVERRD